MRNANKNPEKKMKNKSRELNLLAYLVIALATILTVIFIKPELTGLTVFNNPGVSYTCLSDSGIAFNPSPSGIAITEQDNVTELYFSINNTNNLTVNFSLDTADIGKFATLVVITTNKTFGFMNFTPSQTEVYHPNHTIIKLLINNMEGAQQCFNNINVSVLNRNDVPNVTAKSPSSPAAISENSSISFNITITDPDIPYGDNMTLLWLLNGTVQTNNLSAVQNFTIDKRQYKNQSWTYYPGMCSAGTYNLNFTIKDNQSASNSTFWALTVNNSNRVPEFNSSKNISALNTTEDASALDTIDLDDYFYDYDTIECNDTYSYYVNYISGSSSDVNVSINQSSGRVSIIPSANWCGGFVARFFMNDTYNSTGSNNVTINVSCVPDYPAIVPFGDKNLSANVEFSLYIIANDVDVPFGDSLSMGANISLFNVSKVNATQFLVSFTPSIAQIGYYNINFSVNDSYNLSNSTTSLFYIKENAAPFFVQALTNVSHLLNQSSVIKVNGSDPDGDNITYNASYTGTITNFRINNETGLINVSSFVKADVGNHSINVTLKDILGAKNNSIFNFEIRNIWETPVLSPIGNKQTRVNKAFSWIINATDNDMPAPGDTLTFSINDTTHFGLSNPTNTTATINTSSSSSTVYALKITVNDSQGLTASEDIFFTFTANNAPQITNPGRQNLTENTPYTLSLTVSDADSDDFNVTYKNMSNTSMPSFNMSLSGIIYFTPVKADVGNHTLNFTASDGLNSTTIIVNFSVRGVNNRPVMKNISNLSATEAQNFYLRLNATDIENDTLAFNYSFISSNLSSFSMDGNGTINFTPLSPDAGTYRINFSVHEVLNPSNEDSKLTNLTVVNVNNAPNITFTAPNQTMNLTENMTLVLNATAQDFDIVCCSDNIIVIWLLDGTNLTSNITTNISGTSINSSYAYTASFTSAGQHNLSVNLTDSSNASAFYTWNITVINLNRNPIFGLKSLYSPEFSGFSLNNLNSTSKGIEFSITNGSFALYGNATSQSIDFKEDSELRLGLINLSVQNLTSNMSFSIGVMQSTHNLSFGSLVTVTSGAQPNISPQQYMKIFFFLNSTVNSSTPIATGITAEYRLVNISFTKNSVYANWIKLSDFFSDTDTDDTLSYTYMNSSNVTIQINNGTTFVSFVPASTYTGIESMWFMANDSKGGTVLSNVFQIIVNESTSSGSSSSSSSGGGGSSSTTVEVIKRVTTPLPIPVPKPKTEYVDFRIDAGSLTVYGNDTIDVPLTLVNYGDKDLTKISLFSSATHEGVKMIFEKSVFDNLAANSDAKTNLRLISDRTYGNYDVQINATIESPEFSTSVKIFINPFKKGEQNQTQVNTVYALVNELLKSETACLELNAALEDTRQLIEAGESEKAKQMLYNIKEACTQLTEAFKERQEAKNERIRLSVSVSKYYPYILAGILVLVTVGLIFWFVNRRHPSRIKAKGKRKEES